MQSATSVGRTMGLLLLAQAVAAPVVNFALLGPVTRPPGFLVNAAGRAPQLRAAALLSLLMGAITLAVAIVALPVFRRHGERLALWLVALATVGCALHAVEGVGMLAMLALSERHAQAGAADAASYEALAAVVRALRNGAHYLALLVGGAGAASLYALLHRAALVPRALSAIGLAAALLQMVAVALPVLGARMVFPLLAPLGVSHLVLMLWLLVRGLDERHRTPAVAAGVQWAGG